MSYVGLDQLETIRSAGARDTACLLCGAPRCLHDRTRDSSHPKQEKMRPGSVFGLTTLGLVSRTSMDDRLGDGPPFWEGEQQFHAFLGYALITAMAAACAHSVSHSSRRWRH